MTASTMKLSESRVREILALAEKATPGPWHQTGAPWFRDGTGVLAGSPDGNVAFLIADTDDFALPRDEYEGFPLGDKEDDAAFIAAANPATIKAILEDWLALRELLALIREEAAKDNAPLGRSDSLALDRIRTALALNDTSEPEPRISALESKGEGKP